MIFTVTLNPAVDYLVGIRDVKLGGHNIMAWQKKVPGGKGINVSRVLNRLGYQSIALGFSGGFTGDFIAEALREEGINTDFVRIAGETRINVKLIGNRETEINAISPDISTGETAAFFDRLKQVRTEDVLVLSGSVPGSLPEDIYARIMTEAAAGKVVVDTSGPALCEAVKARPWLIKPNHHELGDIFGVSIRDIKSAITYGRQLVGSGAENVLVSMADQGALLINSRVALSATAPSGKVVNAVGAGDALLAGFLAAFCETGDLNQALQFGVAAGSASVFSSGFCTTHDLKRLLLEVEVTARM